MSVPEQSAAGDLPESLSGDLPAGVILVSREGRIRAINPAARDLFRLHGPGLPDLGVMDLLQDPGFLVLRNAVKHVLGGAAARRTEEMVLGGRTFVCTVGGTDAGLAVVLQDISELKEAEAQHLQSSKMSAVGQLAAGVAHEFNNLIAGIYGYAQFMKERPEPRVVEKGVEVILRSSERARELTASLLTFSRRRPGRREPVDINQILVDTLLLSHRQLEKNRIQVVRRLGTIPVTVADGGRLQQVFLELLINAQQALADGGTLTVSSTSDGGWIDIRIADDGPGIDPEHLPRIFEPFFTTKGALGGAKVPGTGLGLSTAYNIVRDHGGSLRVTSEPNRGACFIVTLPVRRLHETPRRESRPGRPRSLDRSGRMLVVDDDRTLRSLICELLHGLGHETREAEELDQAMGILEIWSADILIVDRMVPGMDDLRGYEQVRASYPELPILFIMSRSSTAGLESEGDPWMFRLNKPFRNRDLMALVTRILSQRLDRAS